MAADQSSYFQKLEAGRRDVLIVMATFAINAAKSGCGDRKKLDAAGASRSGAL